MIKKHIIFVMMTVILFVSFVYLENNAHSYFIKTNNNKDLNQKSVEVLKELKNTQKVLFEVYSNKNSPISTKIKKFLQPYKHINPDLELAFVDPVHYTQKVHDNAITIQGEIVLSLIDKNNAEVKKTHILELSESAIINAILSMQNERDEWMVIGEGFGMASIDDESDFGLSRLLLFLQKLGYKVARMPLNTAVVLPDNVKVLIIPTPSEQISQELVAWLKLQSNKGVSLWWLNDNEQNKQNYMELAFDVITSNQKPPNDKTETLYEYPIHKITENFNQPIFISSTLEIIADSWQKILQSESKKVIAVAKQFEHSRMVISGSSNIIRNQFLNVAANRSMTLRILDWLYYHDDKINLSVKINKNTQLYIGKSVLIFLSIVLILIIPFCFILIAFKQWRAGRG